MSISYLKPTYNIRTELSSPVESVSAMKLFGKEKTEGDPFLFYVRDGKPAAVQGWFFSDPVLSSIGKSLENSGLSWLWESTRTGPAIEGTDDTVNPEHRTRQLVSAELLPTLEKDLSEKNIHGFRRFVALYGGSEKIAQVESDDDLRREVEAFAAGESSILSVLVVQMGDVSADVIYFNMHDNLFIDTLLTDLGAPPLTDLRPLKYRDMKGEDLETVMTYLSCTEHDH